MRVVNSRDSDLLTLAEAAAYLRVHRRTMARLLRQGVVPGTKIGRQWRVRKADLDAVLATGDDTRAQREGHGPAGSGRTGPPPTREGASRASGGTTAPSSFDAQYAHQVYKHKDHKAAGGKHHGGKHHGGKTARRQRTRVARTGTTRAHTPRPGSIRSAAR